MDIKDKTYDIRTSKKQLFLDIPSTSIHAIVPSLYQCVETRSIEVFWLLSQPILHLCVFNPFVISETFATQLWTALSDQHFPPKTGNISLWISFALRPFAHKKTHSRTLIFGSSLLKHGCYFDYWSQPLNMRICYLDCHEVGLCCYLSIHIESLWHLLQLFYFHLWRTYWLSLVYSPVLRVFVRRFS
jgi:hypothetical protein